MLSGYPADFHDLLLTGVCANDRHLQDHLQEIVDRWSVARVKIFGTVAPLQDKGLPARTSPKCRFSIRLSPANTKVGKPESFFSVSSQAAASGHSGC